MWGFHILDKPIQKEYNYVSAFSSDYGDWAKNIDAKDEFDYRQKKYTTTEFLDTTPDESMRQKQQRLNELGYTDKFGEKLKEDGIEGAKTRYAKDKYEADSKKKSMEIPTPDYEEYDPLEYEVLMLDENFIYTSDKLASMSDIYNDTKNYLKDKYDDTKEKTYEILNQVPLSDSGNLSPEDMESDYSETKKKFIKCISAVWFKNGNTVEQEKIHNQAERLRYFDDKILKKCIY